MREILKLLKKDNYKEINVIKDDEGITNIYCNKNNLAFEFIAPHSGNNYKYLLKCNPIKSLDRWSVCDIREEYKTSNDLLTNLDLDRLTRKLLDIYVDYYVSEQGWD